MRSPSTEKRVALSDVVVRAPDQVSARIDEVTAIMSLDESLYYLLDQGGSMIWERLADPILVSDLCASLTERYDVSPEDCEKDVLEFLSDLLTRKALVISQA